MSQISVICNMNFTQVAFQELLNQSIPVFRIDDRVEEVKEFFEDGRFSHVAIYDDQRFLGNLSSYALYPLENDESLYSLIDELQSFWVGETAHWVSVFDQLLKSGADLIPVLDHSGLHKGYYLLEDIEGMFGQSTFVQEAGEVLIISSNPSNFSVSTIVQLIEMNQGGVGGLLMTTSNELVKEVAVKVNSENFTQILSELRRYDYHIDYAPVNDLYFEQLKERSDYLTNYLDL
jgi:CBS domain containing-hemolysin-like protein